MASLPEHIHTDPKVPGDEAIVPETVAGDAYQGSAPERTPETISNFDPYLLRVAYVTGFWYAREIYCVHSGWLWGYPDLPYPDWLEHWFSETRTGISELLANVQIGQLSTSGDRVFKALDCAKGHVDDKWVGEDYKRFIDLRDDSRGSQSNAWESHFSILADPKLSDLTKRDHSIC